MCIISGHRVVVAPFSAFESALGEYKLQPESVLIMHAIPTVEAARKPLGVHRSRIQVLWCIA